MNLQLGGKQSYLERTSLCACDLTIAIIYSCFRLSRLSRALKIDFEYAIIAALCEHRLDGKVMMYG